MIFLRFLFLSKCNIDQYSSSFYEAMHFLHRKNPSAQHRLKMCSTGKNLTLKNVFIAKLKSLFCNRWIHYKMHMSTNKFVYVLKDHKTLGNINCHHMRINQCNIYSKMRELYTNCIIL